MPGVCWAETSDGKRQIRKATMINFAVFMIVQFSLLLLILVSVGMGKEVVSWCVSQGCVGQTHEATDEESAQSSGGKPPAMQSLRL